MFVLDNFLKNLTENPGVYLMYDKTDVVIYVGKAKNLKKRVGSYFKNIKNIKNIKNLDQSASYLSKTELMVSHVDHITVTVTLSETEALILENDLIKKYKPRFNILFRDDKSYPYLNISQGKFPKLIIYRGKTKKTGENFGPYPNIASVREMQKILQKIFKLRDCTEQSFSHRTRPCLQYQMHRCSAPCVGYISEENYSQEVHWARLFLQGKNQKILQEVAQKMESCAEQMDYESAAKFRDLLRLLNQLQTEQVIEIDRDFSVDVLGFASEDNRAVVSVLSVRQGKVLGTRSYDFNLDFNLDLNLNLNLDLDLNLKSEIIRKIIEQIYILSEQGLDLSELILPCDIKLLDLSLPLVNKISRRKDFKLTSSLNGLSGKFIKLKKQWQVMANSNAAAHLAVVLADRSHWTKRFERVKNIFSLKNKPNRIECIDISHHRGEAAIASCVVFTEEKGLDKALYRKFEIKDITPGDDYAAIYQVVFRRFKRLKEENLAVPNFPDLFLIDGGKNQLAQAVQALKDLKLEEIINNKTYLIAISKGPDRTVGLEQIWEVGRPFPRRLEKTDPGFHILQNIRDESHRFAITGHRKKLEKNRSKSQLENIPGIGPKKRKALLNHFGSLDRVQNSTVEELLKVEGISRALALKILGLA